MGRTLGAICGSIALWLFPISLVVAQPACPPDALGVSRTIEVDTHGGPRFGEPTGDPDFLAHGEVVLTFDDGSLPKYTRPILAALKAQCTKATFFSVGEMAAQYPDVLKEVAAEGHTVATHTWSHKNLARLSRDKLVAEIETGVSAVNQALGAAPAPFFRFPYLSDSRAAIDYLKSRDMATFAVDIDSLDWRTHDARRVVQRVMGGLERRGRGIISFMTSTLQRSLPCRIFWRNSKLGALRWSTSNPVHRFKSLVNIRYRQKGQKQVPRAEYEETSKC
jgi:peptidoglycan/xylan/chitin deacetylase (PgdA/CDA1 family)